MRKGRSNLPGAGGTAAMDRMPVYVDFVDIDSLREYVETQAWAMKVSRIRSREG